MRRGAIFCGMVGVLGATVGPISKAATADDPFLAAARFALTGTDDADLVVIDRADCVFEIRFSTPPPPGYGYERFYLNNVDVSRITFTVLRWRDRPPTVQVDIRGEGMVHETVAHGAGLPDVMASDSTRSIDLGPEIERAKHAWQYLYAHGCHGRKGAF
jgi:hypothetical protein